MSTIFSHRHVTAAGAALAALIGVALASMLLIAIGLHLGSLGATPEARFQQSLWAVLLSLGAGIATFCIRNDSKEQSTLFGQWAVAARWYIWAILAALAIRVIGLSIWVVRGRLWIPGPVDEFFARAGDSLGSAILAFVYFCAVVPTVEEILFRRAVFSVLRRVRTWVPYTASVVLFAAVHGTADQGGALLLGLATAYLYLRSGSLLPSIACHAMVNAVGVIFTLQVGGLL